MSYTENNILVAAPRLWPTRNGESIPKVRETYNEALEESGLIPIKICAGMSHEDIISAYQQAQGILFIGGRDYNARLYGQIPDAENDLPDDEQDANEQELFGMALNDGMPILGICRGEQGMGIAIRTHYDIHDGEPLLIQHLAHVTNIQHNVPSYDYLHDNTHYVYIEPETIAHEIYNRITLEVTSGHHQALNKKALDHIPAIVVSAMSLDRIVEMIELKRDEHPFCFGIQAHPEVKKALRKPLFDRFYQEAQKYAASRTFSL